MTEQEKTKPGPKREMVPFEGRASFLVEPVDTDDRIVDAFKRYLSLKDKLLEESDYTWFVVYKFGDKVERKGFGRREDAEVCAKPMTERGVQVELEKKIKKSGALKLKKAFAISCEILSNTEDRVAGWSKYTVRARAPNGQIQDRTGSCDRSERGRKDSPFDSLDATACTRASNRAIMDLLGGENTAEEFEDAGAVEAVNADVKTVVETSKSEPEIDLSNPREDAKARIREIQTKFANAKPKPATEALRGRIFACADKAGIANEELKGYIRASFGLESTKDLDENQALTVIEYLKQIQIRKEAKV